MDSALGWAAAAASVLLAACSLVSPSKDSIAEPGGCALGSKRCGDKCVGLDDPATGCAAESCEPCALEAAQAVCVAGQCRIATCDPGRGDCDQAPANGCEAVLGSDPDHCGTCGNSCSLPGTLSQCSSGKCVVTGCSAGHGDCNANALDGCEVDLAKDPKNCSACGAACQLPNAIPGCSDGKCTVGACVTGRGDCDGKLLNGCEADLGTDMANCGACAAACKPSHGKGNCSVGVCELTECDPGYADCDNDPADGCEAELATDAKNCGKCGNAVASGEICKSGVATQNDAALLAWLDGQKGGWCDDTFTKFMNLCGTTSYCPWDAGTVYPGGVMFCCDPTLMRTYPEGMAVDIGFSWDGSSSGTILDSGGDCEGKRVACTIHNGDLSCAGPSGAAMSTIKLTTSGRFLLSYHVSETSSELWLNGVLTSTGTGAGVTPQLTDQCGPGFVLGARISYWWEGVIPGAWLRFAPFFLHFKDQAPAVGTWSFADATAKTSRSVMLFEPTGVSGDTWTDSVAGRIGLRCGGKEEAEKEGGTVPCDGKAWISDVELMCL